MTVDREQRVRQLEDQLGDMIDKNMRHGLGAEEWRQIFDVVHAGMFGEYPEGEADDE